MYDLFAQRDWMGNPGFPQFLDRRPCEGLAEVSLITADDHRTTVMATPLYVRVRQLHMPRGATKGRRKSLRGLLPRIIGGQPLGVPVIAPEETTREVPPTEPSPSSAADRDTQE